MSPLATLHPPLTASCVVPSREVAVDRLNVKDTAKLAAMFCGAWFAANWCVPSPLLLLSLLARYSRNGSTLFFFPGR